MEAKRSQVNDGREAAKDVEGAPRLTRAELALLDRLASEEFGLPTAVLMENAGRGAAEEVLEILAGAPRRAVWVFAGPGNNGGDACVLARHLANAEVEVRLVATHPLSRLSGDAARMRSAVERMGIPVQAAADEAAFDGVPVLVDGLLGTGFHGEVRPAFARLIEAMNARRASGATVVALDLPSGLDADTGEAARPTVTADVTVTFAALKVGFDLRDARRHLGRIVLATIGAPAILVERVRGSRTS